LSRRNVRSCEQIAERFAATEERFALTGGRSDKTGGKQGLTCASIGRIGAKELRSRNYARTVAKSELIYARCAATGMSYARIGAIYAATVVTFAEIGAMRAGTRTKIGQAFLPVLRRLLFILETKFLLFYKTTAGSPGQTGMSVLLRDPIELDEGAHGGNLHSFDHFQPACKGRFIVLLRFPVCVIPNLAVCTLTVPTKISVRNCL
jgi:hypothetical protein